MKDRGGNPQPNPPGRAAHRYLRFIERARSEWLCALGFELRRLAQEREAGFIVRHLDIEYKAPAHLDDRLVVTTRPISVRPVGMQLLQEVAFQESGGLAIAAKVEMVFVNVRTLRPCKVPPDLMEVIRTWLPESTEH